VYCQEDIVSDHKNKQNKFGQEQPQQEMPRQDELSQEELQAQEGADLPEREAMSLINANVAAPVNLAAALNVLSDNSVAVANAEQTAPITQHN
jgi:hypothetical protein